MQWDSELLNSAFESTKCFFLSRRPTMTGDRLLTTNFQLHLRRTAVCISKHPYSNAVSDLPLNIHTRDGPRSFFRIQRPDC
mmetsp:Transcript_27048/g.71241  ORF Transcript_27048/g.71241 Transcript_27048/m.71241 type:complete len:81 (+) Transcript_27048:4693-4935(+)